MNDLAFKVNNWVELTTTDEKERATACELQITTANESLFMVEDLRSQSTREYIRVSAYPLAVWLVENYFRLKHEVRVTDAFDHALSHRLSAIGSGFIWPNIDFSADGERIKVTVADSTKTGISPVFIRGNTEPFWISYEAFDSAVSELIRSVNARLDDRGIPSHYLKELWQCVASEKSDPLRQLEAQVGLDPEGRSEELEFWKDLAQKYGEAEVLSLAGSASKLETEALFSAFETRQGSPSKEIAALQKHVRPPQSVAWDLGAQGAKMLRQYLANVDAPLHDIPFLDSFGETPDLTVSGAISQNEEIKILLRSAAHPKSLRFEKARLLGDLLLFQNQKISMVTTGLEFRQKAQRAFAAELLVPTEALNKNLPSSGEFDDDAVFRLADEYDVSQVCVVHQIRNRRLPYRSQLSD
ncbi:hypothetical protein FRD01_17620 [Microvenator marinus]|uniref:Uncharacterized protein n=1 Tax=Microvenator marinus TaxID=2600177 RepID=A0A5B8XTX7_9DELT|nr:hypothetical protein [Microvenator marinus]QED29025.1 hypothetical protein FRD01_17620 [Microvenator marinus]